MRICDLHTGRICLTRAFKRLQDQWQATTDHWDDANTRELERHHVQPLGPQVSLMLAAVHRMQEILEQAERDCLDE